MHALILAGGKGSRLAPLTDTRPKPLVPFVGAPFAVGLLRRLRAAGCTRATFLVGASEVPFAPLRTLGQQLGVMVDFFAEESPLDTAGAIRRLLRGTWEPVLVCNGDILTDLDYAGLLDAHTAAGAVVTLALTRVEDPSSFGVVTTDDSGRITRFVEKPPPGEAPANTVNAGTYVLDPFAFARFGGDGPLSFEREVFPALLDAGSVLQGADMPCYWGDLGTPMRLRAGHAAVLAGACDWPVPTEMIRTAEGAAVHATAQVEVSAEVTDGSVVGARTRIGDGARVRGSVLFADVRVGSGSSVDHAIVGEGVQIGAGVRVGEDAVVGDGAWLTDGADVPAGARIATGAMVEAASRT